MSVTREKGMIIFMVHIKIFWRRKLCKQKLCNGSVCYFNQDCLTWWPDHPAPPLVSFRRLHLKKQSWYHRGKVLSGFPCTTYIHVICVYFKLCTSNCSWFMHREVTAWWLMALPLHSALEESRRDDDYGFTTSTTSLFGICQHLLKGVKLLKTAAAQLKQQAVCCGAGCNTVFQICVPASGACLSLGKFCRFLGRLCQLE